MARLHWEPWILSCLLACPRRVIFLLMATASRQLVVLRRQSLQRTTKYMIQLVFYNQIFFYISKERREDTILVCHGWLHYRKLRHSSNHTDPQGDVIVTSCQNKTKHSSELEEAICAMVTWTIDQLHGYEVTIKSHWWPLVKRHDWCVNKSGFGPSKGSSPGAFKAVLES